MPEKTVLGTFFGFFLGQNFFSRPLFLIFFSGSLKFSRGLFRIFSRVDFFFSRAEISEFSRAHFFFSGRIFSAGIKFLNGFLRWFFAKLERVVNFCYRRNFANVPLVSATGKMKNLIFVKRNSKV